MILNEASFQSLQEPIPAETLDDQNETMYSDSMDGGIGQKTYTNLDSSKTWSPKLVTARGNSVDLRSWTMRHPEEWTTREVLDWIFSVVQFIPEFQFDQFRGEKFNQLTGKDLCKMSKEQFCELEPQYGESLYNIFSGMLKRATFQDPAIMEYQGTQTDPSGFIIKEEITNSPLADEIGKCIYMNSEWLDHSLDEMTTAAYKIGECVYDFDLCSPPISPFGDDDNDLGYDSSSGCESNISPTPPNDPLYPWISPDDMFSNTQQVDPVSVRDQTYSQEFRIPSEIPPHLQSHFVTSQLPKELTHVYHNHTERPQGRRGPGRPRRHGPRGRGSTSDYESESESGALAKTRGPGTHKGNHLWEFIRDLLKDPKYTNQLIRWENKVEGVFKIVSSEQVARLWGAKKNNHTMTYEKFSRAMRFCRSAGYFSDVPKNGNYPKKLCFKFGPKSYGWED